MSQSPSVGRIVHFYPENDCQKGQPYPAIITHVNENGSVNLHVFNDGEHFFREECCLRNVHPGISSAQQTGHFWIWPPRDIPPPATTEVPPPAVTEPLGASDGPAAGPNVAPTANN